MQTGVGLCQINRIAQGERNVREPYWTIKYSQSKAHTTNNWIKQWWYRQGHCLGINDQLGELIIRTGHQSPENTLHQGHRGYKNPFFFPMEALKILHFSWFPAILSFLQVVVGEMTLKDARLNLLFQNNWSPRHQPTKHILPEWNILSGLNNISEFFKSWKCSKPLNKICASCWTIMYLEEDVTKHIFLVFIVLQNGNKDTNHTINELYLQLLIMSFVYKIYIDFCI